MHSIILILKPEGRRPLGRPRHACEDINMYLNGPDYKDVAWILLAKHGV